MLPDLFHLSAIWLVLSLIGLLVFGTRQRSSNFLSTMLFVCVVISVGDLIALAWLHQMLMFVGVASLALLLGGCAFALLLRDWNAAGRTFFLFAVATSLLYLVYAFAVTALGPASPLGFLYSFILLILETAVLLLSLTYSFEVLDFICRVRWHRKAQAVPTAQDLPRVSLHVPAYNEPPELVEQTLRALARLDYPSYEVILIDNNTPKESTWQPLARVCEELGFKCLHLDQWPGYKSGALNFALAMTDPKAEIIGVIDADYIVQADYLRRTVPYFADPEIAFVQTPQDYRDYEGNPFQQAAYDGYKYFFAVSMPVRNERNAIIFCGTMGLLRKKVLQEIGGWDELCITEDAEASLRILDRGYRSLYINESFGRGLMPLDLEGMKKQRFRWAFGGIQILRKHWSRLMPWARWLDPESRLTGSQRYFYLAAGLQWFNELLTFAFTIMLLISALLTMTDHTGLLRPVTEAFVVLPVVLIGTNLLRAVWGLRHALSLTWQRALGALTLWFSLTWAVALACIQGLIRRRGVFLRTPKVLKRAAWARAIQSTSWETAIGLSCLVAGLAAMAHRPSWLTGGLLAMCLSQAIIYLSAPVYSLLSVKYAASRPRFEPDRAEIAGNVANELGLGLQVALLSLTLAAFVFAASLLPVRPTVPSWYSIYNPQPLLQPSAGQGATEGKGKGHGPPSKPPHPHGKGHGGVFEHL